MVGAAAVLAAEAEVERGDAEVLEEGRVVRPGAERGEAQVRALAGLAPLLGRALDDDAGAGALQHARPLLRVGHVAGHLVNEGFERVRAAGVEEAAAVGVGVDVGDGVAAQRLGVMLGPLGRAEQARLLGVPRRVDDGAARPRALPRQLAHGPRLLQQRDHPADGVVGPVDPRVVVVAAHHPLVGPLGSTEARDDVEGRRQFPVEGELEPDGGRAGAEVVGDGQRAAPRGRRDGAAERPQQRERVGVGDGEDGNLRERRGVFAVEARGLSGRADAGRQGVAGEERHVGDRAALRAPLVAPRAFRVDVALKVAVVARVGVDEATDGPALGGDLRLDAAPRAAVARDDDLPLHVHAAPLQLLVVARHSVVDVDELAGHVAVDRVGVVGRQLLGGLPRGRVLRERRLREARGETLGRDQFQHALPRRGEEHVVALDLDLVAPRAEEAGHELRVQPPLLRADVVRPRGEPPHPVAQVLLAQERVEARFERPLARGRGRVEALQRRRVGGRRGRRREQRGADEERDEGARRCASHVG